MESLIFWGVIGGVSLLAIMVVGLIMTKLYRRATKERAFVRTGLGNQKVVKDGGALVFPVFHEVIDVNMQTLRLQVQRQRQEALITKDRLRVDVLAEFYVRVKPDAEGIATAAQTLGTRTMKPTELRELVEGKFVDALRSVAAQMDMQELHENRTTFVQQVQTTVAEDLAKNGLELESVSLTGLDQTSSEYFNPDNAFDAEGLAKLTAIIEEKKRERNQIEADTRVAIETKNLEANQKSLAIKRDQEYAEMSQSREIAVRRAEQQAEIASQEAEQSRAAETARITAAKATEAAQIEKDQEIQQKRIKAKTEVDIAEQDNKITVAKKSEENSRAQAEAAKARAEAVSAEELVVTAKEKAIAERSKEVAVIKATENAERDAVAIKVAAAAEKAAAEDRATAIITVAEAEAQNITIRAKAKVVDFDAEANGRRQLNEAENVLSAEVLTNRQKITLIEQMPTILAEMAKPLNNIESVRVNLLQGLNGGTVASNGTTTGQQPSTGLAGDVVNGMLNWRMISPIVTELGKTIGMDVSSVDGVMNSISDTASSTSTLEVPSDSSLIVEDEKLDIDSLKKNAGIDA